MSLDDPFRAVSTPLSDAHAARLLPRPLHHHAIHVPDDPVIDDFPAYSPSELRHRFVQIHVVDQRFKEPSWMHPNLGGEAQYLQSTPSEVDAIRVEVEHRKHNLGEWLATAISGGALAPIAQMLVVLVLYGFRYVLEDVMSAVPLNGGCYNVLLNGASKKTAAVAATCSILCYLATGVVCGVSAFNYVNSALVAVPVVASTVAMLLGFALLCLVGITESAVVALAFFVFHVVTLAVLCVFAVVFVFQHPTILWDNLQSPLPSTRVLGGHVVDGSVFTSLFLGLGPAFLSVTGFETSAQFVEEQAPGVFPKTLRNMWALSSFFNAAITILALGVVPIPEIANQKEVLLAYMGRQTSGLWLEVVVAIDAFVVLAGAVLTSYVGINGLVKRLATDRVLPRFLLVQNPWRKTNHFIILLFVAIASSLVVALDGQIDALAGVFAFAFLGVMGAFAIGCMVLKVKREELPRTTVTSWPNVAACLIAVMISWTSTAMGDIASLGYFAIYFCGVSVVIIVMLERVALLRMLLYISKQFIIYFKYERVGRTQPGLPVQHELAPLTPTIAIARGHHVIGSVRIAKTIEEIKKTPVIFFCKAPNLPKINEAISYVIQNEQTYCLRLVHVISPTATDEVPREFEDIVCLFDHIYPLLKIDFVAITGVFDPATIEWISRSMDIPTDMMLMRQPAKAETHKVSAVGVRIITK